MSRAAKPKLVIVNHFWVTTAFSASLAPVGLRVFPFEAPLWFRFAQGAQSPLACAKVAVAVGCVVYLALRV